MDAPDELVSVDVRVADIGQQDIGHGERQIRERFGARGGRDHRRPGLRQQLLQQVARLGIVIDDEHAEAVQIE